MAEKKTIFQRFHDYYFDCTVISKDFRLRSFDILLLSFFGTNTPNTHMQI